MDQTTPSSVARFAEFELDPAAFELRRHGRPVRVERLPLELLLLLVSRIGELVTRPEIVDKLWGNDVYVDTNTAINVAVRKVRQALRDDPDHPRFLLTVPGKGYRFVGSLEEAVPDPVAVEPVQAKPLPRAEAPSASKERDRDDDATRKPKVRNWMAWGALAALVVVGLILVRQLTRRSTNPPNKRVMLAVLPFKNLSGNPEEEYIADGLTEETITDLGQLSPAELGVIARTSAMAYKSTDKTVSQIGRELGVDYVLEGSVRSEGGKARVSAQLIRVSDQTHLWAKN